MQYVYKMSIIYGHVVHRAIIVSNRSISHSSCFNVCVSWAGHVAMLVCVGWGLTQVWIGGSVMAAFLLLTVSALWSSCASVPLHPSFLSSLLSSHLLRAGLQMSGFPKVSSCFYMFALCFSCLLLLLMKLPQETARPTACGLTCTLFCHHSKGSRDNT